VNGNRDTFLAPPAAGDDWLQPPAEQHGLSSYVRTLRERLRMIVAIVGLTFAGAVLYVFTADEVYEASTDIIIFPAPPADQNLINLPLIRASSDPTRDVETAAKLITNIEVAEEVQEDLDSPESAESLLDQVSAEPVAQSNIVTVTAEAPTPEEAQALANAFATTAIELRTEALHDYIDDALPGLEAQLEENPDPELQATVAQLRVLSRSDDPTMRVQTEATLPTEPVAPRKALSIAVGILVGLVLGVGAAFALDVLDPRLRREEQLRRLYRLPILARIPKESGGGGQSTPLNPLGLSPAAAEAYRSLRGTLAIAHRGSGEDSTAILVTGSSPAEGKTTTAINLATSLASGNNKVILIETDLRRPSISRTLGIQAHQGVVSALLESTTLEDALVTSDAFGPNLSMLLADHEGGWITELFALPAARRLIDEARTLADYVILDSPPLTDVIDALPLASYVDDVLLVVRLSHTRLTKLQQLGELLAENAIRPAGFVVVGTPRPARSDYHYYAEAARERSLFGAGNKRD
jgi:capsular exopolysaccharide synthesis family protein